MLEMVDALIVTGGADVDPVNYNAPADPMLGPTDLQRDAADLAITRAAVESNVPTLATCRGIQVLNVAMGGTLVQHVDEHMRVDMYNEDVHDVEIDPASRLATILGAQAMGVNSMHHQVIDRLGPGVRAVAHNHDGHIEAIEIDAAPAVLGVQWHPELMRHRGDHLALFEDLVRQVMTARS
jgi:putative glutamine amidotransferase